MGTSSTVGWRAPDLPCIHRARSRQRRLLSPPQALAAWIDVIPNTIAARAPTRRCPSGRSPPARPSRRREYADLRRTTQGRRRRRAVSTVAEPTTVPAHREHRCRWMPGGPARSSWPGRGSWPGSPRLHHERPRTLRYWVRLPGQILQLRLRRPVAAGGAGVLIRAVGSASVVRGDGRPGRGISSGLVDSVGVAAQNVGVADSGAR